jgi:glycosyltransferase involved in cell wall biosynthesis
MKLREQGAPKLSVCVMTYNQERYIGECLESIVAQEVDFPFEVIVGDDASTDGTREVIERYAERYPDLIKPMLHAKNLGTTKNYLAIHQAATGEYVAHMDGDDLMLPTKLTKQVEFLDRHPECVFVIHNCVVFSTKPDGSHAFEGYSNRGSIPIVSDINYVVENNGFFIMHSSKMYRREQSPNMDGFDHLLDLQINILQAAHGKVGYLKEPLGEYRLNVGISVGYDSFKDHLTAIALAERFGAAHESTRYARARACYWGSLSCLRAGQFDEFRRRIELSVEHGRLRRMQDVLWRATLFNLRGSPALLRGMLDFKDRFWRYRMRFERPSPTQVSPSHLP